MTDKRTEKRAEKKSETLEVRLPHSKKEAFKAACEEEGITASHAVRTFIDAYLKRSRRVKLKRIAEDITMKLFRNPLKTAGIAGTGIIAAILSSASPSMAEDDLFSHLDTNGDGFLDGSETTLLQEMPAGLTSALSDLTQLDEYGSQDIVAIETSNYADYDIDKDGRFSREEFSAINGVYFEFDGLVGGHQLTAPDGGKHIISFVGPKETSLIHDEAYYRELLKSGNINFISTEPGKEAFTIMTIIKPGEPGNENPPK